MYIVIFVSYHITVWWVDDRCGLNVLQFWPTNTQTSLRTGTTPYIIRFKFIVAPDTSCKSWR